MSMGGLTKLSKNLFASEKAFNYVLNRGMSPEAMYKYELGYDNRTFSKMYDRIIFPVRDQYGKIVTLQGRTLDPNEKVKYYHYKFDKQQVLYGLYQALPEILTTKVVGLVEGNFDVLACYMCGIPAVACQGNAISPYQLSLLSRFVDKIIVFRDSDKGGDHLVKAIKAASDFGLEYTIVSLDPYKDSADVVKDKNGELLKKLWKKNLM